jgi:zinc/manganese transport system substrate-binding protein
MKKLRKIMLAGGAVLVASTSFALADGLKVVASFSILGDMAAQVGGDKVKVTTLVGPDSDAHVYEPKPADAVAFAQAQVVLVNGLGFEGFMERLAKTSASTAMLVEVSKGAALIEAGDAHGDGGAAASDEHGHGGIDPHAFQSVPNARIYVKNITNALCAADAANCEMFKSNASAFDAKLAVLDSDIRAAVAAIPADKRAVITSHDAFGYLAHEYGLTFHAPEGISTDSEASAADVAKLIDQIREEKASALFIENISDPRLVNQISAETGINVGGALYSDALSAPGGPAATYIDLMRHNIATIKGAILGS